VECVNASGFPLFLDQRGAPRPYGPACDSGAFELGAVPLPGDFCINDADRAVYESLVYVDGSGNPSSCTEAASSIAADCVFGSAQSSPPLVGCPAEVQAVIACFPSCSPDVIVAFEQCVADCTEEATGLSTECAGCYGGWAACGAKTCVPECAGGGTQPPCIDCLFFAGCTGRFDACSGLPGSTDCSAVPDHCEGVDCDDQNECTWDECNAFDGSCQYDPVPNGWPCDAGGVPGVCTDGECVEDPCAGNPCDDGEQCTLDLCEPVTGTCENDPLPDGSYCFLDNGGGGAGGDGGPGGNGGGVSGVCVAGTCTEDLCVGNPCYDGNPCTSDQCNLADGSCSNDPVPDGWPCDAGGWPGICTGGECIPTGGAGGTGGTGGVGGG
jgi:hypothetical protein